MNSSYKIALAVAAALCLVILGYYVTQRDGDATTDDIAAGNAVESTNAGDTAPTRSSPADTSSTRPTTDPSTLRPPPRSDSTPGAGSTDASTPVPSPPTPANNRPTLRDLVAAANETDTPTQDDEPSVDVAPPPGSVVPSPALPGTVAAEAVAPGPPAAGGANTALSTTPGDPVATTISTGSAGSETAPPPPATPSPTPPTPLTTTLGARPSNAVSAPPPQPLTYIVEPGDTFTSIAAKLYGDERFWVDIAQANPTVDPTRLRIDQVLQLPSREAVARATTAPSTNDRAGEVRYTVRPGDSLSSIAQQYYGDPNAWRTIFNANREVMGNNPDAIEAGKILVVPPAPDGAE